MNDRIRAILEDYEGLLEMHDEYAESVDLDDIESREIWDQIETGLKRLSRRVAAMRNGRAVSDDDMDEIEASMEDLNDQYGEVALLFDR